MQVLRAACRYQTIWSFPNQPRASRRGNQNDFR